MCNGGVVSCVVTTDVDVMWGNGDVEVMFGGSGGGGGDNINRCMYIDVRWRRR